MQYRSLNAIQDSCYQTVSTVTSLWSHLSDIVHHYLLNGALECFFPLSCSQNYGISLLRHIIMIIIIIILPEWQFFLTWLATS